jgi:hypothetical protein
MEHGERPVARGHCRVAFPDFTIAASALISGVQILDRGNSLIGLPNSLLGAIKFPARLNREFRRNHLRNRTFFIAFSANFAANHEKFPAFSLLAGNLEPETGSPLTVSSASYYVLDIA